MDSKLSLLTNGRPTRFDGGPVFADAVNQLVLQRLALVADNWKRLEELANQSLGMAHGYSRQIRTSIESTAIGPDTSGQIATMLGERADDVESRAAFFAAVKDELLAKNPNIDVGLVEGLGDLAKGSTDDNAVLSMLAPDAERDRTSYENATTATAALAVKSVMALTYASFHHQYTTFSSVDLSSIGTDSELLTNLEARFHSFEAQLLAGIKQIHGDLVKGQSPASASLDLARSIEESLEGFGRTQATLRLYAASLKAAGKGTASEKVGALCARAGDLTRLAFASYGSAYLLALQAGSPYQDDKVTRAIRHAPRLAFDQGIPDGKNTEIAKATALEDGAYIEIAGFVVSIETAKDSDEKLLATIVLEDPSSGARVKARGRFVHLRHIGLTEGTFCRVNGTWSQTSEQVDLQKLAVNEMAKTSWMALFVDLSDRVVDRWPGGLNICFGLSPHVSGEGEGDSNLLGAGELIYKPFFR